MAPIEVVRGSQLKPGESTRGIVRERAFEDGDVVVSRSRVGPRVASGWHHHGARHLYGFLVSGRLRLEHGPGGAEGVGIRRGDFFRISPGLVHRDVNPHERQKAVVVNILVGRGEAVVNVPSPEGRPRPKPS